MRQLQDLKQSDIERMQTDLDFKNSINLTLAASLESEHDTIPDTFKINFIAKYLPLGILGELSIQTQINSPIDMSET